MWWERFMPNSVRFHLEIHSLQEFALFCAIIRHGDALDGDQLAAMVDKLHQASDKLAAAEKADADRRQSTR